MSDLVRGCMGWQVLETLETPAWATRPGSNPVRSHLHLKLRWERSLPLRGSCRSLRDEKENITMGTNIKVGVEPKYRGYLNSPTLGDQAP